MHAPARRWRRPTRHRRPKVNRIAARSCKGGWLVTPSRLGRRRGDAGLAVRALRPEHGPRAANLPKHRPRGHKTGADLPDAPAATQPRPQPARTVGGVAARRMAGGSAAGQPMSNTDRVTEIGNTPVVLPSVHGLPASASALENATARVEPMERPGARIPGATVTDCYSADFGQGPNRRRLSMGTRTARL